MTKTIVRVLPVFLLFFMGCKKDKYESESVGVTNQESGSIIKRGYVEIPEGQMHYRTIGNGPVVMLLHQVVRSSDEYRRVMPVLAEKYKVIAVDVLGFGESVKPARPYTIPDHGKSLISFFKASNPSIHLSSRPQSNSVEDLIESGIFLSLSSIKRL